MDMLVDPDEEGDKYVQITQPEAEMAAAAPSQATNAVQLPPAVGGNAGNQGQSEYSGFNTALKKLWHGMYDPDTIERELKVQGTMDSMDDPT